MKRDRNARTVTVVDLHHSAIPAWATKLPALRHALSEWAARVGMPAERSEDMTLAAYEAMANVVQHAYPGRVGTFDLSARYLQRERCVEVTITDRGQWRQPPADLGPLHGRGLPLMRRLADNVDVEAGRAGTRAVLRWEL